MAEGEIPSVRVDDGEDGHQLLLTQQTGDVELARWAAHGLNRGDKLLVAADARHPDGSALAVSLARHGVDAAGAAQDGRIEVLAPAQFSDADDYEQRVEQSLRDGHDGVRSFGGPHVAAAVLDAEAFAEFERLLGRLWDRRGASALCCYPRAQLGSLGEAVRRHSAGWRHGLLHVHHREPGLLQVHGEIDAANDELLGTALAVAADRVGSGAHGRGRLLVVDCTGLGYTSVAVWRGAVAATEAFRAEGGLIVLAGLHPIALRVLRMTGFAAAFEISEAAGGDGGRQPAP